MADVSLADDLLDQASHLAERDKAKPSQANLRRSVSTAYYAIFHLLGSEAASVAAPANPKNLRAQVQRALAHEEMKAACVGISSGTPTIVFSDLNGKPSKDLIRVATVFKELQEARHKADYDVAVKFERTEVELVVQRCHSAFAAWKRIRGTDEANVFLSALLFQKRWSR